MQGLTDIHTHILPGVDDGAANEQTSMEMLRMAWKDGIRHIILTPHNKPMRHNVSYKTMKQLMEQLQAKTKRESMDFSFYLGNELFYRSTLLEEIENNKACTMAGTFYALVEFGPMDDFEYIRNGVYQILTNGYRPIMAHAERYQAILAKPQRIEELKEMGAYIQINAGSVLGLNGWNTKQVCKKLLKQHFVHAIATDAHDMEKRAPKLSECAAYISKKFGEDYMKQLFYENPKKLLADEYI